MDHNKHSLIVGIDLSGDYTQVSYLDSTNQIQSMSTIYDEQRYLIPTALFKFQGSFVWCIGDEALLRNQEGKGVLIENLLEQVDSEDSIVIDQNEYMASELLELYMSELFKIIKSNCKTENFDGVVVTIHKLEKKLIDIIKDSVIRLGVAKQNIKVISHTESFIYYVLNQKKDIWVNNVGLFEFDKEYFNYKRLSVTQNRGSTIVGVEEKDLSDRIKYQSLRTSAGKEKADRELSKIAKEEFAGHVVSAVFLTGDGFTKKWAKESLQILCNKRRVFQGYNLMVKGAGYCAREYFYSSSLQQFIFQCAGRTKVDISIMVSHSGKETEHIISRGGTNWYEAGAKLECILDNVDYVRFSVTSPVSGIGKMVHMDLKDFPKRPNKTTRIGINLTYMNENQFKIEVTDKGFGEFFPSSEMSVSEVISVSDAL